MRFRVPARLGAIVGVVAIVAVSCGGAPTETVASAAQDSTAAAAPDVAPVDPAPAVESEPAPTAAFSGAETDVAAEAPVEAATSRLVNKVGGGQLDLGSLEGQDTVLWFWAPW